MHGLSPSLHHNKITGGITMSKSFTVSEVARNFGITPTQVYRDLQSWPHQGKGTTSISFTVEDVAGINRIMNAGPDQQMKRLLRLETRMAEIN
jgi:transposase-like protein